MVFGSYILRGQNEPLELIATMAHIPENASSTHLLTWIPYVLNSTKTESMLGAGDLKMKEIQLLL